jgi:4-hydroxy-3-methylbut-2-enyl diphosphate reductase
MSAPAPEAGRARVLVAVPMRLEAWLVRAGAPGLELRRTGIGRSRSRAAAGELRERLGETGTLVVLGFGGGLEPEGHPGEAIVAQELIGPEGERRGAAAAPELLAALRAVGVAARAGAICSVARPAVGAARERLRERGAVAVDMESLWLAGEEGGECAVVRVLSDVPAAGAPRPDRALAGFVRACGALRLAARGVADWALEGFPSDAVVRAGRSG